MSRLAREYPDQPELWADPPVHVWRRVVRCHCGRPVSWDGVFCAEHDDPPPAPTDKDAA